MTHKIRDFTIVIIFQTSKNVLHYIFILRYRQRENRVESTQKRACRETVALTRKPRRIYSESGFGASRVRLSVETGCVSSVVRIAPIRICLRGCCRLMQPIVRVRLSQIRVPFSRPFLPCTSFSSGTTLMS